MTGRVDAVCVSGADLLPLPDRRPNRSGIDKRPVDGRVAVHPLGLDGDVQVNRKHHGGEGQAVYAYAQEDADFWSAELGRRAARRAGSARTCGRRASTCVGARARRAVADRDGAVRGDRLAHPVRQLRPLLGRARPGQALRRARRHRAPTCGCSRPARSAPATPSRSSFRPDHGITVGAGFRIVMNHQARGCPSSPRRCEFLPVKDQPKLAATHRATAGRADRDQLAALLSAAVRRDPTRCDGEVAVFAARRGSLPLLALLGPGAAPLLAGGGGSSTSESAPDLLAKAKTTLDDAKSAHFVLTSTGAPATGTVLVGGEGDIARPSSFEGTLKVHALGSAARPEGRSRSTARSTPSCRSRSQLLRGRPGPVRLRRPRRPPRPEHRHLPAAGEGRVGEARRREAGRRRGRAGGDGDTARRPGRSRSSPARTRASRSRRAFSIATESGELRRAELTGPVLHRRARTPPSPSS